MIILYIVLYTPKLAGIHALDHNLVQITFIELWQTALAGGAKETAALALFRLHFTRVLKVFNRLGPLSAQNRLRRLTSV